MAEAVKGGRFVGEVLIERAVVWADQRREKVGGSAGGGDKGKFGPAGQGLSGAGSAGELLSPITAGGCWRSC